MIITPTAITPFGKGTVGNIAYTVTTKEGEVKPGTAKAFMSDHGLTIGEAKEVEFEKKPPYNNPDGEPETWIKSPPKGGGGFKGGGGMKADPAKLALEREKLNLDAKRNEDIKGMVDKKDCSIISQVILKLAVEAVMHEVKPGTVPISPNSVEVMALEFAKIFKGIQAEIGGA